MSVRVGSIKGRAYPHMAVQSMLAAILGVFVMLVFPVQALAAMPSVSAPYGPMSGGVFTGTYTFNTYIACDSGVTFGGTYSNSLDGTHGFAFIGAPDGSLLVRIDGGGSQLISSCGAPFATPQTTVASYTVTKGAAPPPTPAPTPAPTPTPTPTPAPVPVGGGSTPRPPNPTPAPSAVQPDSGKAAPAPAAASVSTVPDAPPVASPVPTPHVTPALQPSRPVSPHVAASTLPSRPAKSLGWLIWMLPLAVIIAAFVMAVKSTHLRHYMADGLLGMKLAAGPYWFRLRQVLRRHTRGHNDLHVRTLSHRRHTGKLLAHHHTSYPALGFLVLVTAVGLAGYSYSSMAGTDTTVSLTVLGPPPTSSPVITAPLDGDTVTSATITLRGICQVGMLVGLYRNGGPAGSVTCDGTGLFNLLATVVPGTNQFIAYTIDGLGQSGPPSSPVNVTYVAPVPTPTPTPAPTPAVTPGPATGTTRTPVPRAPAQSPIVRRPSVPGPGPALLVGTDELYYTGVVTGEATTFGAHVTGGVPPYTVEWDWGDGSRESMYAVTGAIRASHTYLRSGSYRLVISVVDARGNRAASTAAVYATGGAAPVMVTTKAPPVGDGYLSFAWPILICVGLLVVSFWLGERNRDRDEAHAPLVYPQSIG